MEDAIEAPMSCTQTMRRCLAQLPGDGSKPNSGIRPLIKSNNDTTHSQSYPWVGSKPSSGYPGSTPRPLISGLKRPDVVAGTRERL